MTPDHTKNIIIRACLLLIIFVGSSLRVLGGRDTTCPGNEFPLRLAAGSQARALSALTLYDYDLSTPITEIAVGTRVSLPPGSVTPECYLEMRFVYVETGEGLAGWATEVAYGEYLLEPLGAAAPLSPPSFEAQPQPESFSVGQVDYNGVHFSVDPNLIYQVDAEFVPASDMRGYDPAHLQFRLEAQLDQEIFMFIRVMSAQDLENYYPGMIAALRNVLDGVPGAEIPFDLQWIFSEARLFAQPHKGLIPLGNGQAYWALMYNWQDEMYPSNFVVNSVHGLSDDSQYYIQASFTTYYNDPTIYYSPISDPEDPNSSALLETFHKNINDTIAAASDSDFTPRPSQIQAMLSTLTIDPGTLQEIVAEANIVATGINAPLPELLPTITPSPTGESASSTDAVSTPVSALEDGCRIALMMEHLSPYITSPGAIQMSGSGQAMLADVPDDLNFGVSDLSLSLWVYASPASSVGGTIFDVQYFTDVTQGMRLSLDAGNKVVFEWVDVVASQSGEMSWIPIKTPVEVTPGGWHLLGITIDRDNAAGGQIYLDGAPVFTFDPTANQVPLGEYAQMTLGSNYYGGDNDFYGVIKDLQFYHCLLSPEQMAALMTAPLHTSPMQSFAPATPLSESFDHAVVPTSVLPEAEGPVTPIITALGTATLVDPVALIDPSDPNSQPIDRIVFSPDGQRLIMSSEANGTFRVWDTKRAQLLHTLRGHTDDGISMFAFSPDGRLIVSGGEDALVMVWDTQTGAPLRALVGHQQRVKIGVFSPDGQRLVTGSNESAFLWDIQTGGVRHTLKFPDSDEGIEEISFSPDGQKILTRSANGRVIVWNSETGEEINSLQVPYIGGAIFMRDNETILILLGGGLIRRWNLKPGQTSTRIGDHTQEVSGFMASPDGRSGLFTVSTTLNRVDLETGDVQDMPYRFPPKDGSFNSGWYGNMISLDQRVFYTNDTPSTIEAWDVQTGKLIQFFQARGGSDGYSAIYGYDYQMFATIDVYGIPYLWSAVGFEAYAGTPTPIPSQTPMPSPTVPPTATSTPTPTLTPTPFPLYCPASPPSRIVVGGIARVTLSAAGEIREDLRVRSTPGGERIGAMAEGTRFRVTGGYQCVDDRIWWPIQTLDGALTGWATEGAAPDDYYIEPIDN